MRSHLSLIVVACGACGGSDGTTPDPTDVRFGDTALIVVVNPVVNEANRREVADPGPSRVGVGVSSDDGISAITDETGIAVLAPLTPGARTLTLTGSNVGGSFTEIIEEGQLREVAVATEGTSAEVMLDLDYKSDRVVEVVPTMTLAEVNAALAVSDTVVFFRGGSYAGDIDFSGSRVTLFGEGVLGGEVELQGSISVSGSDSRIRGARITGDLTMPASGVGVSFSRVDGATSSVGSDATFLDNALCGGATIRGSGSLVVDNAGMAPISACP